ncbi:hypothetical protein HOU00_gp118 [Caulobacter phage CcrPW]|uniref:Uncharacterized protein n=1 Tax=Caulobacter phage CcrPW TaxID=2283271 RepID=A0A385ECU3_9CAUD|nr:hypothetical protein HOU00_gp019 [Caulobacter phage CcrPW]YP_009809637.1 hypothetical protein HOU00_gp118 [Caulobacter phage CcrPW]AXQ68558.1 hypothetical protein CcrPW_gp019 [Caulobacter phage CcrPW]AXQ69007.1 hypothetical protein CcrPW_gp468 [Caulobacter phage CcrPW]
MMTNPHALAILAAANKILPLTHLHPCDQRAPAVDIIGDLFKIADDIDAAAPASAVTLPAGNETLAKLGAAVALARLELESAYQRTESISERHRLAPLIATMSDALKAYRADPATPKAPAAPLPHAFATIPDGSALQRATAAGIAIFQAEGSTFYTPGPSANFTRDDWRGPYYGAAEAARAALAERNGKAA